MRVTAFIVAAAFAVAAGSAMACPMQTAAKSPDRRLLEHQQHADPGQDAAGPTTAEAATSGRPTVGRPFRCRHRLDHVTWPDHGQSWAACRSDCSVTIPGWRSV